MPLYLFKEVAFFALAFVTRITMNPIVSSRRTPMEITEIVTIFVIRNASMLLLTDGLLASEVVCSMDVIVCGELPVVEISLVVSALVS